MAYHGLQAGFFALATDGIPLAPFPPFPPSSPPPPPPPPLPPLRSTSVDGLALTGNPRAVIKRKEINGAEKDRIAVGEKVITKYPKGKRRMSDQCTFATGFIAERWLSQIRRHMFAASKGL
jgi:hypothetical protein